MHLQKQPAQAKLSRQLVLQLPYRLSVELVAEWLRQNDVRGFDRKGLHRMITQMKTLRLGQRIDVDTNHFIAVDAAYFVLTPRFPKQPL
mgnify:CR=1 FL=1